MGQQSTPPETDPGHVESGAGGAARGALAQTLAAEVPASLAGRRLDQAVAVLFPEYSRARLQAWIRQGNLTLDKRRARPRDTVRGGERIELRAQCAPVLAWSPEPMALAVVHEDADLMVVNKPAGLVVHPGAGNRSGTLVNALLNRHAELAAIPRAGLVHRLDKDTTGLLIVARTLRAHKQLVAALKAHAIRRDYDAVVHGRLVAGGTVDAPIGRHRTQRTRMSVAPAGRGAVTHYRVRRRFRAHTHITATLETGRTHQIRVHMAHIGHPLAGDPVYAGRFRAPPRCDQGVLECLRAFRRQALHAGRLEFEHPVSGVRMELRVPVPPDMAMLLENLARDSEDA